MAEYLAIEYVKKHNLKNIEIESCGTANYHEGQFMHRSTSQLLTKLNINHNDFKSKQINQKIFDEADYILVMDDSNYQDLINKFGTNNKVQKITNYSSLNYSYVPDPWYTNNFEETYNILKDSIEGFFKGNYGSQ